MCDKKLDNHLSIKHMFDMEYSTQLKMEKYWLDDHGFECSFTKINEVDGIRVATYKYTKTPALFAELEHFYSLKKEYDRQRNLGLPITGECAQLLKYEKLRSKKTSDGGDNLVN